MLDLDAALRDEPLAARQHPGLGGYRTIGAARIALLNYIEERAVVFGVRDPAELIDRVFAPPSPRLTFSGDAQTQWLYCHAFRAALLLPERDESPAVVAEHVAWFSWLARQVDRAVR
jgi:hypothetical protein